MTHEGPDKPAGFFRPHVLYPDHFTWFILVSALDLELTSIVLYRGGREVNWVADYMILHWGHGGLVAFKFALVVFVIVICEWIGRRRRDLGRRLATWAIALPVAAVGIAFVQLLAAR